MLNPYRRSEYGRMKTRVIDGRVATLSLNAPPYHPEPVLFDVRHVEAHHDAASFLQPGSDPPNGLWSGEIARHRDDEISQVESRTTRSSPRSTETPRRYLRHRSSSRSGREGRPVPPPPPPARTRVESTGPNRRRCRRPTQLADSSGVNVNPRVLVRRSVDLRIVRPPQRAVRRDWPECFPDGLDGGRGIEAPRRASRNRSEMNSARSAAISKTALNIRCCITA